MKYSSLKYPITIQHSSISTVLCNYIPKADLRGFPVYTLLAAEHQFYSFVNSNKNRLDRSVRKKRIFETLDHRDEKSQNCTACIKRNIYS